MTFEEMMKKDLEACHTSSEFGVIASHTFAGENEQLEVIFDAATEVILDSGNGEGIETTVPSFSIPTHLSGNITRSSLFIIRSNTYKVREKPQNKDGNTVVYLEVQNA